MRRRFLDDQADGAVFEAAERLHLSAGPRPVVYQQTLPPWVVELIRDARRVPCPHVPRHGSDLVIVLADRRQWLCRGCADRAAAAAVETPDELRCHVCREVAVPLEPFVFTAGTLVASGKHCNGCRATVYGEPA